MRKTIGRRHLLLSDDCDKHSGDQMIVMNTVNDDDDDDDYP